MNDKKNIRNLTIYHSESARDTSGNLVLSLIGTSNRPRKKGHRPVRVNAKIPFYILPYVLREMRKAWLEERTLRLADIQAIDSTHFSP